MYESPYIPHPGPLPLEEGETASLLPWGEGQDEGLPPPSWPHLMRPSRTANEVPEMLVDGRVKPGHDNNAALSLPWWRLQRWA